MAFKASLLRKKMKDEGKTQQYLAKITGKTERTVSRWLNGGNAPKGKDLDVIAQVLKCRPQDFDPSYADEGAGVPIYARVSVASHNAYEMMRLRYGVSYTSIVELAPVLFSIVANYALKVPDDDIAFHNEAVSRGLPSPLPGTQSYDRALGFEIDRRAGSSGSCFGLSADDQMEALPRNLFFEAISRLSIQIGDHVSTEFFRQPEPGEAPTAAGFVPDIQLLQNLTGGDADLGKALIEGRVRLSKCREYLATFEGDTMAECAAMLRRELAKADDDHQTRLQSKREEGLAKLEAWLAYYNEMHPDEASEYNNIVNSYCHEKEWFPKYYDNELREMCWSDPFREHQFIDKNLLPDDQKNSLVPGPIARRLAQLENHRSLSKLKFEELGK